MSIDFGDWQMPVVFRGELATQASSLSKGDTVKVLGGLAFTKRKSKGITITDYFLEATELCQTR